MPDTTTSNDDEDDGEEIIDEEIDVFDDKPDNGVPPKSRWMEMKCKSVSFLKGNDLSSGSDFLSMEMSCALIVSAIPSS